MKAVKIKNNSVIPSGTTDGCVTLNGDKQRANKLSYECPDFNFAVYDNGHITEVIRTRRAAIRRCDGIVKPNTAAYIRMANALVYFHEHGHEPMYFRGFHIDEWKNKPHGRALVDYDNHTSKETTERYDAIAYALEQMAQHEDETHVKP